MEALKSKPAMLVSGDKDYAIAQDHAISDFKGIYPEGRVIKVRGGHFCQEDIPEELVSLIITFIGKPTDPRINRRRPTAPTEPQGAACWRRFC